MGSRVSHTFELLNLLRTFDQNCMSPDSRIKFAQPLSFSSPEVHTGNRQLRSTNYAELCSSAGAR
jgi:hypothetical protein